jgi:hypothetical protein
LCLIFGTKNSKHQGTPGVFGSAVNFKEEINKGINTNLIGHVQFAICIISQASMQ